MDVLVDDVGSFPLPPQIERRSFERAYALSRKAIAENKDVKSDEFLWENFYQVIVDSFWKKAESGLDVVNYPQHYDMHKQLANVLEETMERGTYLIDASQAFLPEVYVIRQEAKSLYEHLGRKVRLRVCVLGPMELYLREVGTDAYNDVLLMFAESVRRFAKNSILDSKHVKTTVISLDEPSFGFREIAAKRDVILDVLEKAFDFGGVARQIHLHSPSRLADILEVKNIDVLSLEFAASPENINDISSRMLDQADKQIRVGISRTDIDSIMAELYDKGVRKPSIEQIAEEEATIQRRLKTAKQKYGERMSYTGPDCGLGGWPSQEAAQLLLKRTVNAVRTLSKSA